MSNQLIYHGVTVSRCEGVTKMKIPESTIEPFGVLGFPHRMPTTVTSADINNRDVNHLYPHQIRYVEDFVGFGVSLVAIRDDEKDGEFGAFRATSEHTT